MEEIRRISWYGEYPGMFTNVFLHPRWFSRRISEPSTVARCLLESPHPLTFILFHTPKGTCTNTWPPPWRKFNLEQIHHTTKKCVFLRLKASEDCHHCFLDFVLFETIFVCSFSMFSDDPPTQLWKVKANRDSLWNMYLFLILVVTATWRGILFYNAPLMNNKNNITKHGWSWWSMVYSLEKLTWNLPKSLFWKGDSRFEIHLPNPWIFLGVSMLAATSGL